MRLPPGPAFLMHVDADAKTGCHVVTRPRVRVRVCSSTQTPTMDPGLVADQSPFMSTHLMSDCTDWLDWAEGIFVPHSCAIVLVLIGETSN